MRGLFTSREQSLQLPCLVSITVSSSADALLGGGTYLAPKKESPELMNSTKVGKAPIWLLVTSRRSVMGRSIVLTGRKLPRAPSCNRAAI